MTAHAAFGAVDAKKVEVTALPRQAGFFLGVLGTQMLYLALTNPVVLGKRVR